jgi:hypothetical protein
MKMKSIRVEHLQYPVLKASGFHIDKYWILPIKLSLKEHSSLFCFSISAKEKQFL